VVSVSPLATGLLDSVGALAAIIFLVFAIVTVFVADAASVRWVFYSLSVQ